MRKPCSQFSRFNLKLYCVFATAEIRNQRRSPVSYTEYVMDHLLIREIFLIWATGS